MLGLAKSLKLDSYYVNMLTNPSDETDSRARRAFWEKNLQIQDLRIK